MRLSQHSDFAFRPLITAALRDPTVTTVGDVAGAFDISGAHLHKVAQTLAAQGYLTTIRGRSGGLRLAQRPQAIRLGDVAALTEPDFQIAPCMPPTQTRCPIYRHCVLRDVLSRAAEAFLAELNRWTLADLIQEKKFLLTALSRAPDSQRPKD